MVGAGVEDESSLDVPSKVRMCGGSAGERVRAPPRDISRNTAHPHLYGPQV